MTMPYTYTGTTETDLMHCNRFYKNDVEDFVYPYNPIPQGFNNIISFSLNDSIAFAQHPWSIFHPIDVAYEMKGPMLLEYSMKDIAKIDREFWIDAFQIRGGN